MEKSTKEKTNNQVKVSGIDYALDKVREKIQLMCDSSSLTYRMTNPIIYVVFAGKKILSCDYKTLVSDKYADIQVSDAELPVGDGESASEDGD